MSSEMSAIMTEAREDPLSHGLLVPRRHVSHLSRRTPHIPLTGASMPSSQHAYLIEQSASSSECKRAAPREVQVRSFPGHTGGDSVVLIPDAKIVFCGDLWFRNIMPTLNDASTQPLI